MNNEFVLLLEQSLSNSLGQSITIKQSDTIGGGCINHASKLETNAGPFFLKWNAACAADMFLREAEGLRELEKASKGLLRIPKVICSGEVGELPGFLLQEYLETRLTKEKDDELLGEGLAQIHKYYNSNFGFYSNNYCGDTLQENNWTAGWVEFYRENRLRYLINLIHKRYNLSVSELKLFDGLLKRLENIIPPHSKASVIHGDLWSGNYMITTGGPSLIDPAVAYAEREMEFGIITMFGGFSSAFFSAYNNVYPLDSGWQERNALYQLYHILNHYYLFGGAYLSQAIHVAKRYL